MSQSKETPVLDTTPTDSTSHLGPQSSDPDSASNPDPSPYDLNHFAVETEHEESNLQQLLQNLDLKEEEEETDKKDDGERESNNDADGNAAEDEDNENEEERNDNEIDGENVTKSEGKRSHYPVRPDAESCAYYMKTGLCKFGCNCKFNHPIRRTTQAFFSNLLISHRLYMC